MSKQEADKRYKQKERIVRQEFYQKVGNSCAFCDSEKTLCCHRKDGKPHMRIAKLTLRQIQKEDPNDYARLCFRCHYGIHWAMKYLGLLWADVEEIIR